MDKRQLFTKTMLQLATAFAHCEVETAQQFHEIVKICAGVILLNETVFAYTSTITMHFLRKYAPFTFRLNPNYCIGYIVSVNGQPIERGDK